MRDRALFAFVTARWINIYYVHSHMLIMITQNEILQAFKNIAVDRFDVMNSFVHSDIPSRAFFDMDIREQLLVVNSTFMELQPNAFAANSNYK